MGRRHAAAARANVEASAPLAVSPLQEFSGKGSDTVDAGASPAEAHGNQHIGISGSQDGMLQETKNGKISRTSKRRRLRNSQKQQQQQQQPPEDEVDVVAEKGSGPSTQTPQKPPTIKSTEQEVIAAVRSLYEDQLKPYGRILRKRLVEHSVAAGRGSVDIDAKHLREICEGSEDLCTEPGEGGEWSTVLREVPPTFVDVYSTADPYPEDLWKAIEAFFNGPEWADANLPGGRYSCAQTLVEQKLDFLAGCSLGQVCHIVQLAISTKKVLGYLKGATVPFYRSQSMVKQNCAEMQQPCIAAAGSSGVNGDTPELPFATWDTVRDHLQHILKEACVAGKESVAISNVKRLFRSDCQTELSETMLGHFKLTDLLQDERLRDICALQLHDQGYVLVAQQGTTASDPQPAQPDDNARAIEPLVGSAVAADIGFSEPRRVIFCPDEPLSLDETEPGIFVDTAEPAVVEFIHTPATQAAITPMFSPSTAFFGDGLQLHTGLPSSPSSFFQAFAASRETTSNMKGLFRSDLQGESGPCKITELSHDEQRRDVCTLQVDKQGCVCMAQDVTAAPAFDTTSGDNARSSSEKHERLEDESEYDHSDPRRVVFCPDEPLCLDEEESGPAAEGAEPLVVELAQTPATQMVATPMFSPSTAFFGDGLQRPPTLQSAASTSLFQAYAADNITVPISLDTLLFRADLHTQDKDAKLGTSKLAELLQDESLRSAFQLQDQDCTITAQEEIALLPHAPALAESSAADMLERLEVAAESDPSEPRRVIFCPDEPLCLDDAESCSASISTGMAVLEVAQTPATQTAATPMFSPSTVFFGDDHVQRSGDQPQRLPALPNSPSTSFFQDGFRAALQQRTQLTFPTGPVLYDDHSAVASLQRMPVAPYFNGCMAGNVPHQSSLASAFYGDAR